MKPTYVVVFGIVICANFIVIDGSSISIAVVILSQTNTYHEGKAHLLQQSIYDQAALLNVSSPTVLLTHQRWPDVIGSWTVLPLIPLLIDVLGDTELAVLFCEDDISINYGHLLRKLAEVDIKQELFLGRALRDREATIIHHFAFHENPSVFSYPDFAAGFLISRPLLMRLAERMMKSQSTVDFSIDAQHELALFIWDNGAGVSLTDVRYLCGYTTNSDKCATWRAERSPNCHDIISDEKIFFAVKTCQKFHKDRIPVLKKTWGKDAKNIKYFSDVEDSSIPTTTLGIPNTERGHCAKFMAILKHVYTQLGASNFSWIVIADDDTLLSVFQLRKLLSCYNPFDSVALGERYGYAVVKGVGYNYITLGGGMALSQAALHELIVSDTCHCAADDSPDDMTFGLCLKHLQIPVTHSPLFHQARPVDYTERYLSNQDPVSFHRHWMIDPIEVYHQWLGGNQSFNDPDYTRSEDQFLLDQLDHREL